MSYLTRLFRKRPDPREQVEALWAALIAEARRPAWYAERGVADTVAGRFDMVTAVLALAMLRMEREPELAVLTGPLTELFVEDMDGQLRQTGVGDLMVGKQIGKLMSTLGGRTGAMRKAIAQEGDAALAEAARRNITLADENRVDALAQGLRALSARFDATGAAGFIQGAIA
ncbi:ubiquinol-cytochrome C chaperone family protein [Qipengyuania sp.]|uniref:ubiquinol-cytochrome C chaperone family protein n=1 Tax=Qipengyuania sp. TaxID=2004515 RepID=UPI0035C82000